MSFTESVRTCLHKYADFNGRASRSEFWWFYLFTILVSLVMTIPIFIFTFLLVAAGDNGAGVGLFTVLTVLWSIVVVVVSIGLVIPLLAAGARRLHDYGQTAWWLLLYFVPCGNIVLIIFWALDGTPADNPYGPRPIQ